MNPNFFISEPVFNHLSRAGSWTPVEVTLESGRVIRSCFGNTKTLYLVCSGINSIPEDGSFVAGFDHFRIETNPRPNEPEVNVDRFMIGRPLSGKQFNQ